jgi:DNA-binding Lrp family transcriptional regulator
LDEEVWACIDPFSVPLEKEKPGLGSQPPTPHIKKEVNKMPTAYILLNTEIGAEKHVLKALKNIDGVEEAHTLWGVYDIIANVRAENMEKLKYIITKRIEKIGKINSKLTMLITERPPLALEEQVIFPENTLIQI